MTASPSKHYSGHQKAAGEEDYPGILRKGILRKKYGRHGDLQVQLEVDVETAAQDRAGWSQGSGSDKA